MLQSAPSSPSAFYHHASRRQSCSAQSPRSQLTAGAASRPKPTAAAATSAPSQSQLQSQSPLLSLTHHPQARKREYKNASTQYSPTGFPPTYRSGPEPCANTSNPARLPDTSSTTSVATPQDGDAEVPQHPKEPPEPQLRIDPQPAEPPQTTRRANAEEQHAPQGIKREEQKNEAAAMLEDELGPSKRARPMEPGVKVMPLKYETCDVKDLGVLVSDMLMELVRLNSGIPLRDGHLTRFHSRAPPGISVRDYLNRLIVHATLSPPILLSMVFYVDKLCTMYPAFTISNLTVHRFLITAATVAAKGLSDSFWTNSLYARVGGVSLRELALLELEFLRRLEWRIVPKPETLVDYYKGLVERGEGYVLEKEDTTAASGLEEGDDTPATTQPEPGA